MRFGVSAARVVGVAPCQCDLLGRQRGPTLCSEVVPRAGFKNSREFAMSCDAACEHADAGDVSEGGGSGRAMQMSAQPTSGGAGRQSPWPCRSV